MRSNTTKTTKKFNCYEMHFQKSDTFRGAFFMVKNKHFKILVRMQIKCYADLREHGLSYLEAVRKNKLDNDKKAYI